LDAQTRKNATLAQRTAFNRQLDAVVQAKSNPTTLGTAATSVKATTSNAPAAAQKSLPQTGDREAVYLEVLRLVLGMFGLVGISRRRED
jgi:LPXTG-motif cell wall-anchored protein